MGSAAGKLRDRVTFAKEVEGSDGGGGSVDGFVDQFTVWAEFRYSGGSEAVQAARLEGRNTFKVVIRSSSQSRQITSDWQARDARRGTKFQIRAVDNVTDPAWVYLVVEQGAAA